ncbi:MAG TPA: hypothetical protein VGN86_13510 [Pyrinomonadaceae bacterium]|nr:hypothetical protein [Pyrinomonadaceae bacterium]
MKTSEITFWVTIGNESRDCWIEFCEEGRFAVIYQSGSLDLDREFIANGEKITFRGLREKLITYNLPALDPIFIELGQRHIGRQLFSQIFGSRGEETRRGLLKTNVSVRIVSDDEEVALLPWSLLASGGVFVAATGWSVAVSAPKDKCRVSRLPPNPKILMVAPCPRDLPCTEAAAHREELESLLFSRHSPHQVAWKFQYVQSWEDFVEKVETFKPDILYYYGHGEGDKTSSDLIFSAADGVSYRVPVPIFAQVLRRQKSAPVIAYINCCQGNAAGWLGVGKQLGDFIPAVITNCTKAYVPAARKQAFSIWKDILIEGKPPHEAVTNTRIYLDKLGLTFNDLRWLTPVLHYSYSGWSYEPPPLQFPSAGLRDTPATVHALMPGRQVATPAEHVTVPGIPAIRDLKWRLKLNRLIQFSKVMEQAEVLLDRRAGKSLAFVVYGTPDQGIKDFYERIEIELPDKLKCERLETIRPAWPLEFVDNYYRSFSETICLAFDIEHLDEICAKVETNLRQRSNSAHVMFIAHAPIELGVERSMFAKHLERLQGYLDWLDKFLVSALPGNVTPIIAFSFVVQDGSKFKSCAEELQNNLQLRHLKFLVLPELEPIGRDELEAFVEINRIHFPAFRDKDYIGDILTTTGGAYERVLQTVMHFDETWSAGS